MNKILKLIINPLIPLMAGFGFYNYYIVFGWNNTISVIVGLYTAALISSIYFKQEEIKNVFPLSHSKGKKQRFR